MEFKADALVLRAVDFGENDRMITLLTAERGKIGAAAKGVKKAGAKLKFAAQPFCFAEYVFAEKNGRNTVTAASLHDGFFPLREDIAAYYGGCVVLECCDALTREGMECGEFLVLAVTALEELCAGGGAEALLRFLLFALGAAGYPVRAGNCAGCGGKLFGRMRFEMESGSFFCESCARGVPASESTYLAVRAALAGKRAEGKDGVRRALRMLGAYFSFQTDATLTTLPAYLGLL